MTGIWNKINLIYPNSSMTQHTNNPPFNFEYKYPSNQFLKISLTPFQNLVTQYSQGRYVKIICCLRSNKIIILYLQNRSDKIYHPVPGIHPTKHRLDKKIRPTRHLLQAKIIYSAVSTRTGQWIQYRYSNAYFTSPQTCVYSNIYTKSILF